MPPKYAQDLTGRRFGFWTALSPIDEPLPPHSHGRTRRKWLCRCDCGHESEVQVYRLLYGDSRSCGCRRIELQSPSVRTHGRTLTPEHRAWIGLRGRCTKPSSKLYPQYGGRGITVCPEWDSFEQFLADMGPRPSDDHSIDRIDNNGPYAPWNCRWATVKEQGANRRSNRLITFNGETKCAAAWAEEFGLRRELFHSRLKAGWSVKDALTIPSFRGNRWRHR
jgi:hypothetical protein